jgi:glycogen synthase kinase 3 beta
MNKAYTEFKFPQIKPYPWGKIFRQRTPLDAIDLISKMLQYVPTNRVTAIEALAHPFFDELRSPVTRLADTSPLPVLFNFGPKELEGCSRELIDKIVPPHARTAEWVAPSSYYESGSASSSSSSSASSAPSSSAAAAGASPTQSSTAGRGAGATPAAPGSDGAMSLATTPAHAAAAAGGGAQR